MPNLTKAPLARSFRARHGFVREGDDVPHHRRHEGQGRSRRVVALCRDACGSGCGYPLQGMPLDPAPPACLAVQVVWSCLRRTASLLTLPAASASAEAADQNNQPVLSDLSCCASGARHHGSAHSSACHWRQQDEDPRPGRTVSSAGASACGHQDRTDRGCDADPHGLDAAEGRSSRTAVVEQVVCWRQRRVVFVSF